MKLRLYYNADERVWVVKKERVVPPDIGDDRLPYGLRMPLRVWDVVSVDDYMHEALEVMRNEAGEGLLLFMEYNDER
jgi:hypothetical protein